MEIKTKEKRGIFPALLTPFDKSNKINAKVLEELVKFNVEKGVSGFYVGGSTAEAFLLSTEERMEILDIVKNAAPEKFLIAHVGSISEDQAIALGKHAKKAGYDMVSAVAPFYYKFSFKEIKKYYFDIAEESELPMLVYHFPAFSGVNMGIAEISQFLEDDKFTGIKFTSNDFFTLEQCKSRFPDKIVYNGFDEMFLSGISMGADGGIGSTYNFMAEKYTKMQALYSENRLNEALEIQKEANRILSILYKVGIMAGEKEILNQLGFDFGECRRPFLSLADEDKALISKEIIPLLDK